MLFFVVWVLGMGMPLDAISLPNSDFERADASGQPAGWSPVPASAHIRQDRSVKQNGKSSVHIQVATQGMGAMSDPVSVQAGAVYVMRGGVQFESEPGRRAFLQVHWFDAQMQAMLWADGISSWAVGGEDWDQVAGTVVAPALARFARVVCFAQDRDVGAFDVWFDAVSFNAINGLPPARVVLSAPDLSSKRQSRVRVGVQDSLGQPVADGTVVVLGAKNGQLPAFVTTKGGVAEGVLQVDEAFVGGVRVGARVGDVYGALWVGDGLAGHVMGRTFGAENGQDRPARVVVQNTSGQVLAQVVANGRFDVWIPPGKAIVTVDGGPTTLSPDPQVVVVQAGDSAAVDLPVRSWVDLQSRGWLAGDFDVRGSLGHQKGMVFVSDVILAARSAGLHWALLTDFWDTSLRLFRPQDLASANRRTDFLAIWGRHLEAALGDQWTMGGDWDMSDDWFATQTKTHSERGIVGYAHPYGTSRYSAGLVFDALAGPTFDALDVMSVRADDVLAQALWFALLNRGYQIAGIASSGAVLDDGSTKRPGRFQTWVHLDGDVTLARLARAVKNGQCFVSSGPLLQFSVFAAGPGSTLPAGRKRRASIRAWSSGEASEYLTRIELIRNGEQVQVWDLDDKVRMHQVSVILEDSVDCWYISKCYGSDSSQVAFTNPIYFHTDQFVAPESVQAVVRGQLRGDDNTPIGNARVLVVNPLGDVLLETVARKGHFQVWAPPTSYIEVHAKGYQPASRYIFEDSGLQTFLHHLSNVDQPPETLIAPETFDQVTEHLQNIEMLFVLKKED